MLSRSEIKDLDEAGIDLDQALSDAERKDAGVDPATLAWSLDRISLAPEARLPGGVAPEALLAFRNELVAKLQEIAFRRARRE